MSLYFTALSDVAIQFPCIGGDSAMTNKVYLSIYIQRHVPISTDMSLYPHVPQLPNPSPVVVSLSGNLLHLKVLSFREIMMAHF